MAKTDRIYLLDADSFIAPYRTFYSFNIVPSYWEKVKPFLENGRILVIDSVKKEILKGGDRLSDWLKSVSGLKSVSTSDMKTVSIYGSIIRFIDNSACYKKAALNRWSANVADPWLIACAKANDYVLVTFEQSAGKLNPKAPSSNPKIPDIAKEFGVETINLYQMLTELGVVI